MAGSEYLRMKNRLCIGLREIQEQAEQRLDNLTEKLMKSQGVTEQLKATNPLEWTRKMNMIYQQAEEAILQELVYQ